jgi:hypothetical protein
MSRIGQLMSFYKYQNSGRNGQMRYLNAVNAVNKPLSEEEQLLLAPVILKDEIKKYGEKFLTENRNQDIKTFSENILELLVPKYKISPKIMEKALQNILEEKFGKNFKYNFRISKPGNHNIVDKYFGGERRLRSRKSRKSRTSRKSRRNSRATRRRRG